MLTALRLFCPAKLNLQLRIVGKRADGYHLLETLFHAIDLGDDLVARRTTAGFSLSISADDARDLVPADDDNLVLRAARAFVAATSHGGGFAFHLHKRVPNGAGLGGGSSDAAAALRLCNALCGSRLDAGAMHELARSLGADVPFFFAAGSQWGRGVGDELSPARVPPFHATLVVPPFGCPTVAVYKNYSANWKQGFATASVRGVRERHHNDCADFAAGDEVVNDLEAAAERVRPELAQLRRRAVDLGVASIAMTGSGSTLFAPAIDAAAAAVDRARLLPLQDAGVRLLAVRSLESTPMPMPASWPDASAAPGRCEDGGS